MSDGMPIIYNGSVTLARLIKEIEDAKNYAEYIINFNDRRSNHDDLYTSGKKIGAQMMLDRLNKIKLERP